MSPALLFLSVVCMNNSGRLGVFWWDTCLREAYVNAHTQYMSIVLKRLYQVAVHSRCGSLF